MRNLKVQQKPLLKTNTWELFQQLTMCKAVTGKLRNVVADFLVQNNIYNLADVTDDVLEDYVKYVENMQGISDNQKKKYKSLLETVVLTYQMPLHKELAAQVMEVVQFRPVRNKLLLALIMMGVESAADITYEIRAEYKKRLERSVKALKMNEYVKAIDQVKLKDIQKRYGNLSVVNRELKYGNKKVFLLYYPDYEIAKAFYYLPDKEELLFDFSVDAPIKMKRQIFDMLVHVLYEVKDQNDRRKRFIAPLKLFYRYCVDHAIEDIEQLTGAEKEEFRNNIAGLVGTRTNLYMQIVYNTRKYLFLKAEVTNWQANVWFLERFSLQTDRINPANEIITLSFEDIRIGSNREWLKKYMKYLIGISVRLSLQTIRCRYYFLLKFLKYSDAKGIELLSVSTADMTDYIRSLDKEAIQGETYNDHLCALTTFFYYLVAKKALAAMPFDLHYYLKRIVGVSHSNRALSGKHMEEFLEALGKMPETIRLIYLILAEMGIRVSEACALRGNSLFLKDGKAWLQVYQPKMKKFKTIPIIRTLYDLIQQYIHVKGFSKEEYVFQNKHGGAFNSSTFTKTIKELGLSFQLRSHDFRHTIATEMMCNGVPIEAIRDYLGHNNTDMTKCYLDYFQEIIDAANVEYFSNHEDELYSDQKGWDIWEE